VRSWPWPRPPDRGWQADRDGSEEGRPRADRQVQWTDVKIDGTEYTILREDDVLACGVGKKVVSELTARGSQCEPLSAEPFREAFMAAKQLLFSGGPAGHPQGVEILARRSSHASARGDAMSCWTRSGARPRSPRTAFTVAKEIGAGRAVPQQWRSDGARGRLEDVRRRGRRHTTRTVLAESIFREGLKNVTAGSSPKYIKPASTGRGVRHRRAQKLSKPVRTTRRSRQVATISANSDTVMGGGGGGGGGGRAR